MKRLAVILFLVVMVGLPIFGADGSFAVHYQVPSKYLSFAHNVIIYLPPGYKTSKKRYPVLYAHDGQNLFDTDTAFGGREWKLDENIDDLTRKKLIPEMIVVGIYNNAKRIDEYTPSYIKPGVNKYLKHGGGGELKKYARFMVEELKPFIDKTYRTKRGRKDTGVMGSSLGGIASLYILSYYPKVFSKAACISPSFWWDKHVAVKDVPKMRLPRDVKIYIDGGWKEGADESSMISWMRLVYKKLRNKGLRDFKNLLYYEDPVGSHSESSWARRGKWPLLFMFGKFKPQVKKLSIQLSDSRIGIGDNLSFYSEGIFKNGSRFTRFARGFTLLGGKRIKIIRPGKVKALKAGKAGISFSLNGKKAKREFIVEPFSRNRIVVKLEISSPNPVKKIFFHIIARNGKKVNEKKSLTMLSAKKGKLTYVGKFGNMIRFIIVDDKGRKAITASGRVLRPGLSISRNRTIKLKIQKWK